MPAYLFYFFAVIALAGGVGVVLNRNPVSCAFSMIFSFIGVAALFIGLNAYFIGTIQILVYAGAIMVLFLFIIMLLDLRVEERSRFPVGSVAAGGLVGALFVGCLVAVLHQSGTRDERMPALEGDLVSDAHAIGQVIYSDYHFPLQVVAVLLLVATVGVVVLSKRQLS